MLRIVAIGAGRLAGHLLPALHRAGHRIVQVYSRTRTNAEDLANQIGADVPGSLHLTDPTADLYILSVPDDAIPVVCATIAPRIHQGIVVHCSGAAPLDVLAGTNRRGVLYPLQSFSPGTTIDWQTTPIFITAEDEEIRDRLIALAKQLSPQVFPLAEEQKAWLHLAAVFANNFSNHTLALSERICASAGISFAWLKPLIRRTLDQALATGPAASQTGPAVRNDQRTIEKHIELLRHHPEWQQLYALLTESIRETALHRGQPRD